MDSKNQILYSVIVPAYNEEENIPIVAAKFAEVFKTKPKGEVILVDDGSTDKTLQKAQEAAKKYDFIKVTTLPINSGKTAALLAGFACAQGDIFVIFDADLQFDPYDVPRLVQEIQNGSDIATGWKQGKYEKRFVSWVYNYLSRKLFKVQVHDLNSIKAFKKQILDNLILRKDWHRYMIVLAAQEGYKISEIKVRLYPRMFGKTKYHGFWRIPAGVLDLISVKFQTTFMQKPLLFFGSIGFIMTCLGVLIGIIALAVRIFFHEGFRPILNLIMLLVISGLLLFILGFLAEAIVNINEKVEDIRKNFKK